MDARQIKALQIVAGGRITRGNGYWLVPSQRGESRHRVVVDGLFPSCSCSDFELTGQACKHMHAVREWVTREDAENDPTVPELEPVVAPPTPKRKTYRQDWPNYNKAQTREKGHVLSMLADLVNGLRPASPVKRGRGCPAIPVADNVFAAVYKVYAGWSARRFMYDLDAAHKAGHLSRSMSHNSVLRALEDAELTPVLKDLVGQTALPLASVEKNFAVDSSGFCTSRFHKWFDHKWGGERSEHVWVKVHLVAGCLTNCVTAAEILDMHAGDAAQLPGLIDTTAEGFKIENVLCDKAYPSTRNYETVHRHGGTMYAPFRSNTTGGVGGLFEKAFHFFNLHRDQFLARYHQRSNVESSFSGIKRVMGDSVRSKTDTAMKNEVYCKLIAWNMTCLVHAIYEMGVVPVFWSSAEPDGPRDIIRFPTIA